MVERGDEVGQLIRRSDGWQEIMITEVGGKGSNSYKVEHGEGGDSFVKT